jgi:hypothetical protein
MYDMYIKIAMYDQTYEVSYNNITCMIIKIQKLI